MSRYLFLALGLAISVANASEPSPSKTTAPDAHDLAYSLGASLGERLRQEVPQLQIQRIERATHWVVHEQPQRVAASIGRFLAT